MIRLDIKHRKKFLYLPEFVTQLSIFAHSGELDEQSDLMDESFIGARYRINRIDTFEAEIVGV